MRAAPKPQSIYDAVDRAGSAPQSVITYKKFEYSGLSVTVTFMEIFLEQKVHKKNNVSKEMLLGRK